MPDPFTNSSASAGPTVTPGAVVHVHRVTPMQRLLSFAGRSIDDVVNCPVARRHVIAFYRVGKQIDRAIDIAELERQWNTPGRR